jgi:hypothetical protein
LLDPFRVLDHQLSAILNLEINWYQAVVLTQGPGS